MISLVQVAPVIADDDEDDFKVTSTKKSKRRKEKKIKYEFGKFHCVL